MGVACVCAQAELGLFEQSGFGVSHVALGVFHSFGRGTTEFSRLPRTDSTCSQCSVYFGGLRDDRNYFCYFIYLHYRKLNIKKTQRVTFLFCF